MKRIEGDREGHEGGRASHRQSPFFIVGSGRSGTTMLRLLLNRHSVIRIPRESWFLIPLMDALPLQGALTEQDCARASQIIREHSRWKDWECNDRLLEDALSECPGGDLAALIDRVFRKCCGMGAARRWGDKTPKYSFAATRLAEVFPDALFVHVIRDARDVYLSMWLAGWFKRSTRRIATHWDNTTSSANRLREVCPDRLLEVHYPDLVKDPQRELKRICRALGETYEPEMLEFYKDAGQETAPWEKTLHAKTRRPPRLEDIDRWRKDMPLWRVFFLEAVARKTMLAVGQVPHFGKGWAPLQWGIRVWYGWELRLLDLKIRANNRLARVMGRSGEG